MTTRKRTILVVDDSEICREMVRFVLQTRGYEVVTVDSPFSFGSALSQTNPDLVLVDANMPALQGDKLVAVALQNGLCSCPIVFHSDRPAEELQMLVRVSGATGFIRKTSDPNELILAVEDYLVAASSRPSPQASERSQAQRGEQGPVSQRFGARAGEQGPVSQRLGARVGESGVFPSSGPMSTRLRTSKV